jgi:tetratricopeptide (TPR) repeat protein
MLGENDRFEEEARRALALNPNDPETLADVGHYLAFMGEFERGAELSRRAQQLNPLYPSWYNFSFARLHYHQKRYEDAVVDVQHAGLPHFYWTHLLTAAALGQLGRAEAGAARAHIFELSGMRHRTISNISCRVCGKLAYEHQISLNLTCRREVRRYLGDRRMVLCRIRHRPGRQACPGVVTKKVTWKLP